MSRHFYRQIVKKWCLWGSMETPFREYFYLKMHWFRWIKVLIVLVLAWVVTTRREGCNRCTFSKHCSIMISFWWLSRLRVDARMVFWQVLFQILLKTENIQKCEMENMQYLNLILVHYIILYCINYKKKL